MKNRIEKKYDDFKPIKAGKSSPSVLVPYRNRSGMVELVGREPLMFARVENGVTKFSPKKTPFGLEISEQKQQFCMGNFHFLATEEPTFGGGIQLQTWL